MKPGDRIGHYCIEKRLGEGGVGEVFRALDEDLDRTVAIKRLRPELSERPLLVQRFRGEAQTLARLNHPNIATLFALEHDAAGMWMAMEYVEGETVAALLRSRGRLELAPALQLFFQALDGIGYAHEQGVIHRDLKGSNLMLSSAGKLKIMDFGIARVLGGERLTRSGQLVGTPEFMAPEQIRGEDADERSDLYALTTLLFALLSGRPPFTAPSEYDLMRAQVEQEPPSLRDGHPELPEALDFVLRRALAKEPDDRYATAEALRGALEPFAPARPPSRIVWPIRAPRRRGDTPAEAVAVAADQDQDGSEGPVDLEAATVVGAARPRSGPVGLTGAPPVIECELLEEPHVRTPLDAPTESLAAPPAPTPEWSRTLLPGALAAACLALAAVLAVGAIHASRSVAPSVASPPRSGLLRDDPLVRTVGVLEASAIGAIAQEPGSTANAERSDSTVAHEGSEEIATRTTAAAAPGAEARKRRPETAPTRTKEPTHDSAQGEKKWVIRR